MYDVIIISGGPAGLTAGIYCGRFKLKTKILERQNFGGLINLTETIENYPGAYQVNSKELTETMLKQCRDLETVELEDYKEVISIENDKNLFSVNIKSLMDGSQTKEMSSAIIVATGSMPKKLGVIGEEEFVGRGVSYCAVCDAPFFKGKDVVVIGGGDTALEEALYLAKFASKVYVVHRRNQLRGSAILGERAKALPNVEFVFDSVCEEILGEKSVEKIRVKNVNTGKAKEIFCSGVFIFVGYTPNTIFLNGAVNLTKDGWVVTDDKMLTNKSGMFACGDCRDKSIKQIIVACGEAATASFHCYHYIQSYKKEI